jgi:hypothetical protein
VDWRVSGVCEVVLKQSYAKAYEAKTMPGFEVVLRYGKAMPRLR